MVERQSAHVSRRGTPSHVRTVLHLSAGYLQGHFGGRGRGFLRRQVREQRRELLEVQWFHEVRVESRFLRTTPASP